jgi:eukaryotic-like serine/threonine-protein kinase
MITPLSRDSWKRIDEYRLLGSLGSGGFGQVFVARSDSRPRELVALKVLFDRYSNDPQFRRRFAKEIRTMAAISSEYVPRVIKYDEHQGRPWYASELVRGPTLHAVVSRRGPLPVDAVWQLGLGIVSALEDIHRVGAHRDLKPGNVLLVPEGPKVIDFGVAHLADEEHGVSSQVQIGAVGYSAPEQQLSLKDAGREADIYSLGATLLFAATGHAAYAIWAEGLSEHPNLTGLPSSLFGVISSCLYKEKQARPLLADLRTRFTAQARGAATGSRLFSAVLPAGATDVIREWRDELEAVIAGDVATSHREADAGGHDRQPTSRLTDTPTRLLEERRQRSRTLIYPGTTPPPIVAPAAQNVRWQQVFGDWVRAPVAVAYRVAVAGSLDGTLACLDAESGAVISSLSLGAAIRWVAVLPGGERACAADADGGVHIIDLRTGEPMRLFSAPCSIEGTPVEVDSQLYTVSGSGDIYEIDSYSGDWRHLYDLREPALGALAAGYGLLFAVGARMIWAIDVASRQVRWQIPSPGQIYASPIAVAGRLYLAGADGVLRSIGVPTGDGPEQVAIGAPVHKAIVGDANLDLLYVPGADGQLRAFDISGPHATRPALAWQRGVGEEIGGITLADGIVHCTVDGTVTGLEGSDGKRRYRVPIGGMLTAAPTPYRQSVYVGALDGAVSCVTVN